MASRLVHSLILYFLIAHVTALTVLQGSPCYTACNGNNQTTTSDIVCTDNDLENTPAGQLLNQCMNCLSNSSYAEGYRTDAFTFLYYNTVLQQSCLVEPTEVPISYCSRLCDTLNATLSEPLNQGFFQSPYDYCTDDDNEYILNASSCMACLQAQVGSVIVGNFVQVGIIACSTQPAVWDGQQVQFGGGLFNSATLDAAYVGTNTPITQSATSRTSSATGSIILSSATGVSTTKSDSKVTATSTTTPSKANGSSGGFSRGAAAGVGLIVGLIGVTGIVVFAIFIRRHRRQSFKPLKDSTSPEPPRSTGQGMSELSKPVKAWVSGMSRQSSLRSQWSQWYYAAYPKESDDLSALPQREWR